jgi:glycosyltransferase involved in cell wall biosynthesis
LEGLVVPDETGLLVEPQQPAALAAALAQLVHNPDLAARWGQASRRLAAEYAWPAIAARHLALYAQLAAGKSAISAA